MSTKFGLLIDFDLLKAAISSNVKPEIVLSGRGRHLDKAIWRPNRSRSFTVFLHVRWRIRTDVVGRMQSLATLVHSADTGRVLTIMSVVRLLETPRLYRVIPWRNCHCYGSIAWNITSVVSAFRLFTDLIQHTSAFFFLPPSKVLYRPKAYFWGPKNQSFLKKSAKRSWSGQNSVYVDRSRGDNV